MKKILWIVVLSLLWCNTSNAGKYGEGELQLTKQVVDYFITHIRGKGAKHPSDFYVTLDGTNATAWYCGAGPVGCKEGSAIEDIKHCERRTGKKCKKFSFKRTIKWKNGINPGRGKASRIDSKWSDSEIYAKLTELGFYGNTTTTKKIEKKEAKKEKKVVKKYSVEGERPLALSWDGYSNLIAGTVKFNESDYKGVLNLALPNNDGTCKGSYSLQADGKGTWQISCTNNMGAAGTLKWVKDGAVTGTGRDHNDKKVKFTVSKKS